MPDPSPSAPLLAPPLSGIRIIEIAGVGPGPFCGMMLADHGAEVIRIDRAGGLQVGVPIDGTRDVMLRSRRTISLDLKSPAAVAIVKQLVATADGLIEGFRPGVMERLGLGPDVLMQLNPALVYGRMTGWGQDGPLAAMPGHDINYIALNGVLDSIGHKGSRPVPPLNLVGDYGGGGLMLAFGMVTALLATRAGAPGRVIDCAMTEGASALMAGIWTLIGNDWRTQGRGTGLLDSGAPFYDTYATADGGHVAIGAIEDRFFRRLCDLLGLQDDADFADQYDQTRWEAMRATFARTFATHDLAHWQRLLEAEDVCFSAVLPVEAAPDHPHNRARGAFIEVGGVTQPAPAPRFGNTEPVPPVMWREDADRAALLEELGFTAQEVAQLERDGAFGRPPA
ncbi:CaiB/BaiF CoA-transferase family protein [Novosphingobium sp.]|uniref:CaiB/BaiF CoA transferase family protein n=1 Tax=Novosphingobium sp. TaxID=1874826 RepID=UPI00262DED17|nr:CaiB/BaiF CoA-transferase family protein [Novosphingobium sp.]